MSAFPTEFHHIPFKKGENYAVSYFVNRRNLRHFVFRNFASYTRYFRHLLKDEITKKKSKRTPLRLQINKFEMF